MYWLSVGSFGGLTKATHLSLLSNLFLSIKCISNPLQLLHLLLHHPPKLPPPFPPLSQLPHALSTISWSTTYPSSSLNVLSSFWLPCCCLMPRSIINYNSNLPHHPSSLPIIMILAPPVVIFYSSYPSMVCYFRFKYVPCERLRIYRGRKWVWFGELPCWYDVWWRVVSIR